MKSWIFAFLVISVLSTSTAVVAGDPPSASASAAQAPGNDSCMDKAQSQADMTQCAGQAFSAADKELNQVYQQVLKKYAKNTAFIAKFKAAQKAWLAFRDAELAARFPDDDKSRYGSVYPMCAGNELEAMTRKRTEELRAWLKDAQEGEVCAGSYQAHG